MSDSFKKYNSVEEYLNANPAADITSEMRDKVLDKHGKCPKCGGQLYVCGGYISKPKEETVTSFRCSACKYEFDQVQAEVIKPLQIAPPK